MSEHVVYIQVLFHSLAMVKCKGRQEDSVMFRKGDCVSYNTETSQTQTPLLFRLCPDSPRPARLPLLIVYIQPCRCLFHSISVSIHHSSIVLIFPTLKARPIIRSSQSSHLVHRILLMYSTSTQPPVDIKPQTPYACAC